MVCSIPRLDGRVSPRRFGIGAFAEDLLGWYEATRVLLVIEVKTVIVDVQDMLAGLDNLDASSVDSVGPFSRVRPERVRDFEAGVKYDGRVAEITANAFAMEFRNEILPVGILIQGYTPLRVNVFGGASVAAQVTPKLMSLACVATPSSSSRPMNLG